ncbi:MAG: hypothetical protein AAF267_18440 [Deinococcota bacterium]
MIQGSYQHILAIGTTGMLAAATRTLAQHASQMTCLARTPASLARLVASMPQDATKIHTAEIHTAEVHTVTADYQDSHAFMDVIDRATQHAPIDMVVAWFHQPGMESCSKLISYLDAQARPVDMFHVVGSAARDPSNPDLWPQPEANSIVTYHQIILGFVLEGESSRWLTHQEISEGLLEAIHHRHNKHIVGTVRPWSARP